MINRHELFSLMSQGATVITPTNRLANELIEQYLQQSKTKQWRGQCMAYQHFLIDRYQKFCLHTQDKDIPVLITAHQWRYLIKEIIKKEYHFELNAGLIDKLENAWLRLHQWRLDWQDPAFHMTGQSRQFQKWMKQLEQRLQLIPALSAAELPNFLENNGYWADLDSCIWTCFDDYTPEQLSLQNILTGHHCPQYHCQLEVNESTVSLFKAATEQEEFQQLKLWLQDQLVHAKRKIGIIIPKLETEAWKIEQFLAYECPSLAYSISLGKSLHHYPINTEALQYLSLDLQLIHSSQAQLILHSPYIYAGHEEFIARAQFFHDHPCFQEEWIPWQLFIELLAAFAPKLHSILSLITAYPKQATMLHWVTLFHQRLEQLSFAEERHPSTVQAQAFERFLSLFDNLRQMELFHEIFTAEEAIQELTHLAQEHIFQPKTASNNVQILGLLEAAGVHFDALWVLDISDECFPQKANLCPFIPINLQKKYQMPHASVAREVAIAEQQLARLKHSASSIIFSYARFKDDKHQLASPLLGALLDYQPLAMQSPTNTTAYEDYEDNYQLPLPDDQKLTGGTAILAKQAKCPFQAFAAYRLSAHPSHSVAQGLTALERGQLVHRVLELLWGELKSQANLLQKDAADLSRMIMSAVEIASSSFCQHRSKSFSSLIQKVEAQRTARLVHALLEWEKQRPDFQVVGLEQEYELELGGILFKLRVDRIDQLNDGQKWVIDYKTSFPSSLPWFEERPREPQLLFYALLDDEIDSLLFISLKNGQLQCKGISENQYEIPGVKAIGEEHSWPIQRQEWKNKLEGLAQEFVLGHVFPQPISSSVCTSCHYQSLCRLALQPEEI